jgi:hypothetical protein
MAGNKHPETAHWQGRVIWLHVDNDPRIGMSPLTRSWTFVLLRKGTWEDVEKTTERLAGCRETYTSMYIF